MFTNFLEVCLLNLALGRKNLAFESAWGRALQVDTCILHGIEVQQATMWWFKVVQNTSGRCGQAWRCASSWLYRWSLGVDGWEMVKLNREDWSWAETHVAPHLCGGNFGIVRSNSHWWMGGLNRCNSSFFLSLHDALFSQKTYFDFVFQKPEILSHLETAWSLAIDFIGTGFSIWSNMFTPNAKLLLLEEYVLLNFLLGPLAHSILEGATAFPGEAFGRTRYIYIYHVCMYIYIHYITIIPPPALFLSSLMLCILKK